MVHTTSIEYIQHRSRSKLQMNCHQRIQVSGDTCSWSCSPVHRETAPGQRPGHHIDIPHTHSHSRTYNSLSHVGRGRTGVATRHRSPYARVRILIIVLELVPRQYPEYVAATHAPTATPPHPLDVARRRPRPVAARPCARPRRASRPSCACPGCPPAAARRGHRAPPLRTRAGDVLRRPTRSRPHGARRSPHLPPPAPRAKVAILSARTYSLESPAPIESY